MTKSVVKWEGEQPQMEEKQQKAKLGRFTRMVKLTYTDIDRDKADSILNQNVQIIMDNDGKVISFIEEIIGVGLSTVYMVFFIIYEAPAPISDSVFKNVSRKKEGVKNGNKKGTIDS